MTTTRIGFWTLIESTRHCGLGQEVACWFNVEKPWLVLFDQSNNSGAIYVKMDGSVIEEKSSFKMLGQLELSFTSKLDWGSHIITIAKTASKKFGTFIHSIKFLSPQVALYLYKSTIWPCIEYSCLIWAGASSHCLIMLDKLKRWIFRTVGSSFTASELLAHLWNVASLSLFYR